MFAVPADQVDEADRRSREAAAIARELGDEALLFRILWHRINVSLIRGDRATLDEDLALEVRLGEKLRTALGQYYPKLHTAMLRLLEGKIDESEALGNEAFAIGQRAIQGNAIQWFRVSQGSARDYHRGDDLGSLIPLVQGMIQEFPDYPVYRVALAQTYARTGQLEEAREIVAEPGGGWVRRASP